MSSISSIFKKTSLVCSAFVLSSGSLFFVAGDAFADDVSSCAPPANDQNGVHWPVGADAGTFTYQCAGPYAGNWANAYYSYNPATAQRTALYAPDYTYDCTTNTWMMTEWDYSPASGAYNKSRVVAPSAPSLATGCPAPVQSTPPPPSNVSTQATSSTPAASSSASTVSNSGPGSNNTTNSSTTTTTNNHNTTNLTMNNGVYSNAATGNSFVIGNTTAGSATSGDAQAVANIANLLQSASNALGPGAVTFTANINGDVTGDFMFDPSAVLASGPESNNQVSSNLQVNTDNTNSTNAQINNAIDVGASSGNATVASNTTGGDATTGNASAVVNLMNLINSTVAAGQSFIGTININGDLNGDILLPQNVLDQLLASSGPGSNNSSSLATANSTTVANNITEAVVNNIASSAISGSADVSGNTTAGSASTGSAGTNVTLLNLTGSNTIGKNDLLVFVNVLGKWVGMIMNAPAGSTAAELGGGITDSGPSSNNTVSTASSTNTNLVNNANLSITNNVNVHATTGDALVANNTTGGNATSGNAHTAVNVLNLIGSNISLSDWFGILFINVFGSWNGSFGVNTSAGDVPSAASSTQNPVQQAAQTALAQSLKQFASFTSHPSSTAGTKAKFVTSSAPMSSSSSPSGAVLGSMILTGDTQTPAHHSVITSTKPTVDKATHPSYLLLASGFGASLLILAVGERERWFGRKQ